jgi:hypothetical protein
MTSAATATHTHPSIKEQVKDFVLDIEQELERETLPPHDSSQADLVVRKHVDGLAIAFFSLVALFLLGAMIAIGIYGY